MPLEEEEELLLLAAEEDEAVAVAEEAPDVVEVTKPGRKVPRVSVPVSITRPSSPVEVAVDDEDDDDETSAWGPESVALPRYAEVVGVVMVVLAGLVAAVSVAVAAMLRCVVESWVGAGLVLAGVAVFEGVV